MSIKKIILISAVLLTAACQPAAPPFQEALDTHFKAIQTKDIELYKTTLTKSETLPLIFPDGSYMPTREQVEAFHTGWFEDKNWRMAFEEVTRVVGKDLASILLRTSYRDTPEGPPRFAYLNLLFQLQDGEWRLIHDQNTRIMLPVQAAPQTAPTNTDPKTDKEN